MKTKKYSYFIKNFTYIITTTTMSRRTATAIKTPPTAAAPMMKGVSSNVILSGALVVTSVVGVGLVGTCWRVVVIGRVDVTTGTKMMHSEEW